MIAEESTSFAEVSRPTADGGLGFDYKWNMGWMHDTLRYFSKEPIHRRWHQNDLTFGMLYQYAENFVSVFSHDEVVHGKALAPLQDGRLAHPGEGGEPAGALRALVGLAGQEAPLHGRRVRPGRTNGGTTASLDWHLCQYLDHEGVRLLVRDLNRLYASEPALSANDFNPPGFRWVACNDAAANLISYLRIDPQERTFLLFVGHFGSVRRGGYRIGVPQKGFWREVINSNSEFYGGTGEGNEGGRQTEDVPCDGQSQSLLLNLPPLAAFLFKWTAA